MSFGFDDLSDLVKDIQLTGRLIENLDQANKAKIILALRELQMQEKQRAEQEGDESLARHSQE